MANLRGSSEIQEFYRDTNVFITGGTGLLGRIIVEKLLRSCPDIKKIYFLCRPKKEKEIVDRIEEQFDEELYDMVRKTDPNFKSKIVPIVGDCAQVNLGISEEDLEMLTKEVNIIFHCAATIRFTETLRKAVWINVRCTRDLLLLARGMKQLKALVHVSSAYSNCVRNKIEETFYEQFFDGEILIKLAEIADEDLLRRITPGLLGEHPYTYTYAKGVAEDIVKRNSQDLPVGIIRPGIIISSLKEPFPGWCYNVYGGGGAIAGVITGLFHNFRVRKDIIANMVPVDYVSNASIVAAWDIARSCDRRRKDEGGEGAISKNTPEISIYNYTGLAECPLTWGFFFKSIVKYGNDIPTTHAAWTVFAVISQSKFINVLLKYLFQIFPMTMDFVLYCTGKKARQVNIYNKLHDMLQCYSYFATKQWTFGTDNTRGLYRKMNRIDQMLFNFDMSAVNWDELMKMYVIGARVNILKDPLTTVPRAKRKYRMLKLANLILMIILGFMMFIFIFKLAKLCYV